MFKILEPRYAAHNCTLIFGSFSLNFLSFIEVKLSLTNSDTEYMQKLDQENFFYIQKFERAVFLYSRLLNIWIF